EFRRVLFRSGSPERAGRGSRFSSVRGRREREGLETGAAGFADTCGADAGLLVGVLPDEGAKVWRSFEMNFLSILRPQLWSFALVGNHGCDARRRRIRRASTTPATKPPACAHHATPASPGSNPNPFTACNPNHNTKNTTAGTG